MCIYSLSLSAPFSLCVCVIFTSLECPEPNLIEEINVRDIFLFSTINR